MNAVEKLSDLDRDPKGITELNPYYVALAGGDATAGLVLREIALAALSRTHFKTYVAP